MKEKYKHIKTEGYYVYYHQTPDKLVYFGMSRQQPCRRWMISNYKGKSLYSYIEKFGWENIKHAVIQDGLTKEQAQKVEGYLIKRAKADGFSINQIGSGGWTKNKEKLKEYKRKQLSQPEWKIFNRVNSYNHIHPDRKLITPLEAKEMYELTGYIPDFIKKSDLI